MSVVGTAVLSLLLSATVAHGAPLSFVYGSALDSLNPNQPMYEQGFASRAVTQIGSTGQHMVWWDSSRHFAVTTAARYDEAYVWLDASICDIQTGTRRALRDVDGAELPNAAGWISFGGFSADGTRFALAVCGGGDDSGSWPTDKVMVFNSATGQAIDAVTCSSGTHLAISPDGNRVVYSYGSDVTDDLWMFTVSPRSDALWMDGMESGSAGRRVAVYWPVSGAELVLNTFGDTVRQTGIRMVNPNTRAVRVVNSRCGTIYDVTEDGRYTLVRSLPPDEYVGNYELGRLDLATGGYARALSVKQFAQYVDIPRAILSPDGSRVLFEGWLQKGQQGHVGTYPANLYRCTYTGTGLARVATDARNPSWVPGDVAVIQSTSLSKPALSPSRPSRGRKVRLTSRLVPASASPVGSVKALLYRWERKRVRRAGKTVKVGYWRLRATVPMARMSGDTCVLGYRFKLRGKWKARTAYSGSIDFHACSSRERLFNVR